MKIIVSSCFISGRIVSKAFFKADPFPTLLVLSMMRVFWNPLLIRLSILSFEWSLINIIFDFGRFALDQKRIFVAVVRIVLDSLWIGRIM